MKLTAKIRLDATAEQRKALLVTLEQANACANWISEQAWERKVFAQYALHRLLYHEARRKFPLTAQVVVRVFAKVADAYKLDKKTERRFREHGAISYDSRILRYKDASVSIWTVAGRMTITFSAGDRQKQLLKSQQGESDLIFHRNKFYLAATCDVPDPDPQTVDDFLGCDLGVKAVVATSDGELLSGSAVNNVRYRHRKLRTKLQSNGSRRCRRKLKALSGREARFASDTNHRISKQIVANAQGTGRGIALEELKGIRSRVSARRQQRAVLHSWSFFQLRTFLEYKARLAGVPVEFVDPRNTSRECHQCGHTEKANRKTQAEFLCRSCGHAAPADINAALNIRSRANRQLAERRGLRIVSHNSAASRLL